MKTVQKIKEVMKEEIISGNDKLEIMEIYETYYN
jgi:hypothetical protein